MANPFGSMFKAKVPGKTKKPEKAKKATRAKRPEPAAPASLSDLFQQEPRRAANGPTSPLPRFHTSATDQLDSRRNDRWAAIRTKVRNAYTPSQPVADPKLFAGRRGVLSHMIRAIEDQRLHLVLYGERGIGKTSLLHTLTDAARDARYIVVYWSCGATSNFDETFRAVAGEIPLLYHSRFSPTTVDNEVGSTLADLLPQSRTSPRVFGELAAKLTSTRVLIILDEFDRCESLDFRREVAELIKIMSDRSVRVNVVIAGVGADLAALVEHIPSIRRNILAFKVPLMNPEEVLELVQIGERNGGVDFDAASRDMVVNIAHGSPYVASLVCHHAALSALDRERTRVAEEDLATGLEQAISELRERIPRQTQQSVDRLASRGGAGMLGVLAGASLTANGAFDDSAIQAASKAAVEAAKCQRFAAELAVAGELMSIVEDEGRRYYRFNDEGMPSYLWLLGARQLVERQPPAEERVAGSAV